MKTTVTLLTSEHNTSNFSCGNEILNDYLKNKALENSNRGIARAYVALLNEDKYKILGFYTLSNASIEPNELHKKESRGLPKYRIGAMLMGRLAVDLTMQGKGFGGALLFHAIKQVYRVSQVSGCRYIVVDAKDEAAKNFYLKNNFISLPEKPFKLIMPLKTIEKLVTM